ncbi:MAG: FAD-dependent thymidylate synthase [Turicibacter sp.]|nr:FAD-dependent thymidylate synthase [Turicibacter sp.]
MYVKLLRCTERPEELITSAAKLCYSPVGVEEIEEGLTPESTEKFIKFLLSLGHESPLEHVSFSFAVEGVSRILETQLVRHRIASYSVQSGRYVKRDNPDFVVPIGILEGDFKAQAIYDDAIEHSIKAYNDLTEALIRSQIKKEGLLKLLPEEELEPEVFKKEYPKLYQVFEKKAIENARYVYPQALATKLVCTFNARSFLNFMEHRGCRRAQNEINELAWRMLKELRPHLPTLSRYFGPTCLTHRKCKEGKMSCGEFYTLDEVKLNESKF